MAPMPGRSRWVLLLFRPFAVGRLAGGSRGKMSILLGFARTKQNHVTIVGGNANNGTNARTFTLNANNDSSNRNQNIGRQLAGKQSTCKAQLRLWGEYVDPITLGSESEQRGNYRR
jgi:hypothetical protein